MFYAAALIRENLPKGEICLLKDGKENYGF